IFCIFSENPHKLYAGENKMMKKICGQSLILILGGIGYGIIEILWRQYTHWTMVITGGVCFSMLYNIFLKLSKIQLWKKCILGSGIITGIEFAVGCVVNLIFKMGVWDYSARPFNILGQICPLYSFLWACLSCPIALICGKLSKTKLLSS
ncbi:MAG: hypothetical protein ACI4M3_07020, partial [Acutalibacteraceae bacterium]